MTRVLLTHPSAELYGSDRMAAEAAAALIDGGASVTVALPVDGPLVARLTEVGARVEIVDVPVIRKSAMKPAGFARLAWSLLRAAPAMRRTLRLSEPDVVYVNTVVQPWWAIAARLARRRVVVHVREAETDAPAPIRRALLAPLRAAHTVIANSRSTASQIGIDCRPVRDRTVVVYNGKDWGKFTALGPTKPGRPFRLLFVGRLSPRKGIDVAVAALKKLTDAGHDVSLDLAGAVFPGYEWYEAELRRRVSADNLEERVRFLGFVEDTPSILFNCDALVVPSRVEPFGTVAAEGMAASRPVIVSDVQGLVEIVTPGSTGFVFPSEDADELAERVIEILQSPRQAAVIALAGKESVVSRFSSESYANQIRSVVLAGVSGVETA